MWNTFVIQKPQYLLNLVIPAFLANKPTKSTKLSKQFDGKQNIGFGKIRKVKIFWKGVREYFSDCERCT